MATPTMSRGSPLPDIPIQSLCDFITKDWYKASSKTAVIFCEGRQRTEYTFGQLRRLVQEFALGLHQYGVGPGDVLLILSTNNVEFLITVVAGWILGATITVANYMYTADELTRQLDDSGAKVMFVHQDFVRTCEASAQKAGIAVKDIIVIGNDNKHTNWSSLLELGKTGKTVLPPIDRDPKHDVAVITYSSGTTGLPKGVNLTHYNFVAHITQFSLARKTRSMNMVFLPMVHMSGLFFALAYVTLTSTYVMLPRFEPVMFFRTIQEMEVEELVVVPAVAVFMYKSPLSRSTNLNALKNIVSLAAPLRKELQNGLCKVLGNVSVTQAYGLSETTCLSVIIPDGVEKPGCVGFPLPGVEIRVVDLDTGIQRKTGDVGEVWIRGPNIMSGYLNRPRATAETIDTQGWLHTGDVGYVDTEGYLYVIDRIKEMIKYKGYQVAPAELDMLLLTHSGIEDAAVIGLTDDDGVNELPTAFVVRKPGHDVVAGDVLAHVNGQVAPYKRLRGVHFIKQIPRTTSGKVIRRRLKEMTRHLKTKHSEISEDDVKKVNQKPLAKY